MAIFIPASLLLLFADRCTVVSCWGCEGHSFPVWWPSWTAVVLTCSCIYAWWVFQTTAYSFSFPSGTVAVGCQKGNFLFICCLYVSEYAAGWCPVHLPKTFGNRGLQIHLAASTFHLQNPKLAGKSELINVKVLKQQLIRMLGWILTFSELGINVKMAFCIKKLIIALFLWTLGFAKVSWLS